MNIVNAMLLVVMGHMLARGSAGTTSKGRYQGVEQDVQVTCTNVEQAWCRYTPGGVWTQITASTPCSDVIYVSETTCKPDYADCSSSPCMNGATCASKPFPYSCMCVPGITGGNCEIDINECASSPCQNGGKCADKLNGYTCACPAGFTGNNCQTDVNECSPSPCANGGSCTDQVNGYTCTCPTGTSGINCQNVNGGWSDWSSWGSCSLPCGSGTQSSSRTCTNPTPQFNGTDCSGLATQSQACGPACVTVDIQVDNVFTLYVDGVVKGSGNDISILNKYTVPSTACLFAVDATDLGSFWGIKLISNVISTGTLASWKCVTSNQVSGTSWTQSSYDDKSWPMAVSGNSGGITPNIWAAGAGEKSHVYCRGKTASC